MIHSVSNIEKKNRFSNLPWSWILPYSHKYTIDLPWIYHGYTTDIPWIYHGYTMDIPWIYIYHIYIYIFTTHTYIHIYIVYTVYTIHVCIHYIYIHIIYIYTIYILSKGIHIFSHIFRAYLPIGARKPPAMPSGRSVRAMMPSSTASASWRWIQGHWSGRVDL